MKFWLIAALSIAFGSFVVASPLGGQTALLGAKECTWGPTHWCQNLTNAKNCNAVKHCIQTVWEKQTLPEDNDSVCQICLDMVKQARDQLESNQTQDDLRAVFEGSCKLMYVKPIVHECIRVVDNFIPELIEALASQMNPQVVCSVAGLCNNAHIDQLLEESKNAPVVENVEGKEFTCGKCSSISSQITTKFHTTSRDTVLENMLEMCGRMGSFSDACSSILLTYFNEIYTHLSDNLTPDALCHLSGACAGKFHQHPELVEIRPMSDVGFVDVDKDDIPCELCEQLVNHLRDLLTANTTESEFKSVLEGLCGQTKGFKAECLSIVDQYYAEIYEFITKGLDPNAACFYIGVCPKGEESKVSIIAPLVPLQLKSPKKKLLGADEPKFTDEEIQSFQLPVERLVGKPIDRLMGAPNSQQLVEGGTWCTMCEYAMHFVQEELADPKNEEQIKNSVMNSCAKFPKSLRAECDNFVELYGDALIALLIQEIDPAQVCPQLKFCPSIEKDSEIFSPQTIDVQVHAESMEKGSCPLCLLAVEQAQTIIQQDKSEEKVKETLKGLCSHLKNKKLNLECTDFVDTYSKELIELLMRDFTPQEICVYLRLCSNDGPKPPGFTLSVKNNRDEEIETNEIADNTIEGIMISTANREVVPGTPECELCKEIIKEVEKRVINKKSKAEIKQALEHACDRVPRKAKDACHTYVDKYGDRIVDMIMEELSPKEVCRDLQLCFGAFEGDLDVDDAVQVTVYTSPIEGKGQNCIICQMIVARMDKEMENPKSQAEIQKYLEKVCVLLPQKYRQDCDQFVDRYAQLMIQTADHIPPKQVCKDMGMCAAGETQIGSQDLKVACLFCHDAIEKVKTLMDGDKSEKSIENALNTVCTSYSYELKAECDELISSNKPALLDLLKRKLTPGEVCSELTLCPETGLTPGMKSDLITCPLCIYTMEDLIDRIESSKTAQNVTSVLNDFCDHLPKSNCRSLVTSSTSHLITSIVAEFPPDGFCAALKFCDGDLVQDDKESCPLCIHVVENVGVKLESTEMANIFKATLDNMCMNLPQLEECPSVVSSYIKKLVNVLENLPPDEICVQLELCDGMQRSRRIEKQEEIIECSVCNGAVTSLAELIQSEPSDMKMKEIYEDACRTLSARYFDRCMNLVHVYGISIIEQIKDESISTSAVCSNIGMCYAGEASAFVDMKSDENDDSSDEDDDSSDEAEIDEPEVVTQKKYLVGNNECTWGPSYWCKDEESAKKCNTLDFCIKKSLGKWSA